MLRTVIIAVSDHGSSGMFPHAGSERPPGAVISTSGEFRVLFSRIRGLNLALSQGARVRTTRRRPAGTQSLRILFR